MDELPWFLHRLALDGSADQRAIRRAYAREIKRIDQGADAEGFQLLREAYETALHWDAYQRQYRPQQAHAAAEPAPARTIPALPDAAGGAATVQPAAPQHAPDRSECGPQGAASASWPGLVPADIDPQQLSADVFEACIAGCSALAQGRSLHDASAWEQHLRTCLHDDRLMNLAARSIFEARIVHLLASGWRSGHETLLEAAADVFQWRSDRHRLRQFGQAGAIVDRAIDERSMFDNQEHEHRTIQRQVIARLREGDLPEAQQLRADMPHVEQLAMRFPTWLELVTSQDNVEQWRAAHAALPPEPQPAPGPPGDDAPPIEPKTRSRWQSARRTVFWLLLATAALRLLNQAAQQPPALSAAPSSDSKLDAEYAEVVRKSEAHRMEREARQAAALRAAGNAQNPPQQPAPQAQRHMPPSDERIEEIRSRIRYRVTHMETPGQYRVEYKVKLDGRGRVALVELHKPSGLPLYDAMVERAIRAAPPFPAQTAPQFLLSYGLEIIRKPAAPAAREPAAPEPAAPR